MAVGFRDLDRTIQGSKEELLDQLKQILKNERVVTNAFQLDLLSGQRALAENPDRASRNILDVRRRNESQATRMEGVFVEQHRAIRALVQANAKDTNTPRAAQLHQLVSFYEGLSCGFADFITYIAEPEGGRGDQQCPSSER
jgi:hypothetical protein